MNSSEIERRKPVWLAISEFYLDTELEIDDVLRLKEIFKKSGFSLKELKDIDFFEVKPIVGMNIWSPAGEWTGFNEDWLWNRIQTNSFGKKRKNNILTRWKRKRFESDQSNYWNKFRSEFQELMKEESLITLNTTGELYNYVLASNIEWDDFFKYSNSISKQLNTNFTERIEDFDTKYWDFSFNGKVFTLHYHSMVGSIEIHTDKSNGTTDFHKLLDRLGVLSNKRRRWPNEINPLL